MADDDPTSFDPRYDPAFQPGYEGPVGDETPRRLPSIPSVPATQPATRVTPQPTSGVARELGAVTAARVSAEPETVLPLTANP